MRSRGSHSIRPCSWPGSSHSCRVELVSPASFQVPHKHIELHSTGPSGARLLKLASLWDNEKWGLEGIFSCSMPSSFPKKPDFKCMSCHASGICVHAALPNTFLTFLLNDYILSFFFSFLVFYWFGNYFLCLLFS